MKALITSLFFAASAFSQTPWMSAVTPGNSRNDGPYAAGMKLTTGSVPISLTGLGRFCFAGNSAIHTVYLVSLSGAVLVSAPVHMAGCVPGSFAYGPATFTLAPNTSYYLLSAEPGGGDAWGDNTDLFTTTAAAVVSTNAYTTTIPPTQGINAGGTHYSYGPVSFQYTGGPAAAPAGSPGFPVVY